jgi:prolyl-tRNA synthetase
VLAGRKTARERFAGANTSWTCEGMMRDGKALQMGTSHELGQNFARVFDITYLDEAGETQFGWQTSWGVSTRLMGALIMAHGDDGGLRLPPRLAPTQVVVLLVRDEDGAGEAASAVARELADLGLRVELDARTDVSFGRRAVDWELKGVPVRVEIGPRDLAEGKVTLVRRDDGSKSPVPRDELKTQVAAALGAAQAALFAQAQELLASRTVEVGSVDEAREAAQVGFARLPMSVVGDEGETALNGAGVTVRCLLGPEDGLPDPDGRDKNLAAVVGRAY